MATEECSHTCKGDGQCNTDSLLSLLQEKEELLNSAGECGLKLQELLHQSQQEMEERRVKHEREMEDKVQEVYELKVCVQVRKKLYAHWPVIFFRLPKSLCCVQCNQDTVILHNLRYCEFWVFSNVDENVWRKIAMNSSVFLTSYALLVNWIVISFGFYNSGEVGECWTFNARQQDDITASPGRGRREEGWVWNNQYCLTLVVVLFPSELLTVFSWSLRINIPLECGWLVSPSVKSTFLHQHFSSIGNSE